MYVSAQTHHEPRIISKPLRLDARTHKTLKLEEGTHAKTFAIGSYEDVEIRDISLT